MNYFQTPDLFDKIAVFEATAVLGDISLATTSALIECLKPLQLFSGQILFESGETADRFFFIGAGRLDIEGAMDNQGLWRGDIIGWQAFIHSAPHDHTVTAARNTLVYALMRADFDSLVDRYPDFTRAILHATTPKPRCLTTQTTRTRCKQIGIFTTQDLSHTVRAVSGNLISSLQVSAKRVRACTFQDFQALSGLKGASADLAGPIASDTMSTLEHEHDAILFAAYDDDPAGWCRKVAAQVDTIVIILRDDVYSLPSWLHIAARDRSKRIGLVLIKDSDARTMGRSRNLIQELKPDWHYRLSASNRLRWHSISRMALGMNVNVVLAGGGAVGAMHCGILSAMVKAGFPVDTIGGTSVGGCVAAGYALGFSPDEISRRFRHIFHDKRVFSQYTMPFHSLLSHKRFDAALREITEGFALEDSEIPIFVTATNLTSARRETIRSGPAWEAMRMTASLPALLPAFVRDGCAYVDGGVLDNFPIALAHKLFGGISAGVTFELPKEQRLRCQYVDRPGASQSVLSRFNLKAKSDFPQLSEVLIKSMILGATNRLNDSVARADLLLNPPMPVGAGLMSFARFDEFAEIGRIYAEAELERMDKEGILANIIVFDPIHDHSSSPSGGHHNA